jgi:hypothetical protein
MGGDITVSAPIQFSGSELTLVGTGVPTLTQFQFDSIAALRAALPVGAAHVIALAGSDPESAPIRLELNAACNPNGATRRLFERLYVIRAVSLDQAQSVLLEPWADLEWTVDPAVAVQLAAASRPNRRLASSVVVTDHGRGVAKAGYGVRSCNNVGAAGPATAIVYDPGVAVGWVRHIAREAGATTHEGLHTHWR